jgi:putative flippase GtrA
MKSIDVRRSRFGRPVRNQRRGPYSAEFVRFAFFGGINTGITYVIYLVLLSLLPYGIAYTISYAAGIFVSYWLNATFVFGEKLSVSRALQYPLVYVVQYVLGICVLYLLIEVLGCSRVLAPLLVVIVTLPVTFLLSRYLIKRPCRLSR